MGAIEPCNCAGEMAGGLPRRAGFLDTVDGPYLLLDVGCFGNGARDFEVLRARATLRAMAAMGYDAANVAEHELWLGADGLADLAGLGVPLTSANVRLPDRPGVIESHRLASCGGLDVVVTGAVDAACKPVGEGLEVAPAREALADLLPDLRRAGGVVVLLADLTEPDVRGLAEEFPEITLILFRGRGDSLAPERVNRTVIASIYGEARYVGDLELTWASPSEVTGTGKAVLLDTAYPSSRTARRVRETSVAWYKNAVEGRTFDLAQTGPGWEGITATEPPPGNRYVGSQACRHCHKPSYEVWSAAPHARAMKSLQEVGYDHSPECIVCHVVGYGASDGYRSVAETPTLARVGCESCHGRGRRMLDHEHADLARTRGAATCQRCHTRKRHPGFEFRKHWARIRHEEPS